MEEFCKFEKKKFQLPIEIRNFKETLHNLIILSLPEALNSKSILI